MCISQLSDGKIFYALAAIKGVGETAVRQIISEREEKGPYKDLSDFFSRIDIRQVNKRAIESLICAGALDCFGHSREQLAGRDGSPDRLMPAEWRSDRDSGQNDMFGASSGISEKIELPVIKPWIRVRAPAARVRGHGILPVRPSAR